MTHQQERRVHNGMLIEWDVPITISDGTATALRRVPS